MTADTFEINASPEELATMTAQLDAAEAGLPKTDDASATYGDSIRTAETGGEAEAAPESKPKSKPTHEQGEHAGVKPKDSSSTPDANDVKVTQKDGNSPPKDGRDPNAPNPKSDAKVRSSYAREMERREKSWRALNEEKQKFAGEQARLARERQEFEHSRQEQLAAGPQYTAGQYENAARVFEAEGKRDLAAEARAEAATLRANPPTARIQEAQRRARISTGQARSWEQVATEYPGIRKVGSPENVEALKIVNEDPHVWNTHPNAPLLIARMAVSRLQAARVPELEQGLAKAKARIEELERLTSPAPGGGPTVQAAARSYDEKSLPEQEAELRQMIRGN